MKVFRRFVVNIITVLMWIEFIYCASHYIEIDLVIKTLIIAIISFVVMVGWKIYNIKRFGSLRRRQFPKDTDISDLVEFFKIDEVRIKEMQDSKIIVLEKNLF